MNVFLSLLLLVSGSLVVETAENGQIFEAKIVSIFISKNTLEPFYYELITPAIDLAVQKVKLIYPHIAFNITYRTAYNTCANSVAEALAAEEYFKKGVTAFIGPGCTSSLESVSRLASYWNIPIFSSTGLHFQVKSLKVFDTFLRILTNSKTLTEMMLKVLEFFKWRHVTAVIDLGISIGTSISRDFRLRLQELRYSNFNLELVEYDDLVKEDFTTILAKRKKQAKIFIIITTAKTLREFLLSAYALGMENGDFVFIGVDLFNTQLSLGEFSWYIPGDFRNKMLLEGGAGRNDDDKISQEKSKDLTSTFLRTF
ncbi:atrial natriuretic peptide receptor 3-like [Limulus polyphemus]|uniref:Atrial natriuretic peptide receptor 3-like n=1 Tax=Limulus polyphemus TaxID=6850 RepID=A0ABM1BSE9_LIMPO|nr:atrial natriuretic peptide receptor 3-like [Limulus polyphemus]